MFPIYIGSHNLNACAKIFFYRLVLANMKTRNGKTPVTSTPRTLSTDPETTGRGDEINLIEAKRRQQQKELEEMPSTSGTVAQHQAGTIGNGSNTPPGAPAVFSGGPSTPYEDSSITMPIDAVSKILSKIRSEDKTIPYFYGCVLDWPIFAKKYHDTTEDFQITDDANQKRLDKALKGAAREHVRDLLRNACLVGDVMAILQDTYGGEDNIIAAVTEAIGKMRSLQPDLRNIVHFTIGVKKVHLMLRQLASATSSGRESLMRIVKLLPLTERRMWANYLTTLNKNDSGTIEDLLNWLSQLKDQCKVHGLCDEGRESARQGSSRYNRDENDRGKNRDQRQYYDSDKRKGIDNNRHREPSARGYDRAGQKRRYPDKDESFHPRPRIMTNLLTTTSKVCVIEGCTDEHQFADCPKFKEASQPERYRLIRKHRRCPVCCSSQHNFSQCNVKEQ